MIVETQKQYDEIPDGTKMKIVQVGDGWDNEKGKVFNVIKVGNNLHEITYNYWEFNERNDCGFEDDLSFIIIK